MPEYNLNMHIQRRQGSRPRVIANFGYFQSFGRVFTAYTQNVIRNSVNCKSLLCHILGERRSLKRIN
jgi:hypothetical protein